MHLNIHVHVCQPLGQVENVCLTFPGMSVLAKFHLEGDFSIWLVTCNLIMQQLMSKVLKILSSVRNHVPSDVTLKLAFQVITG